MSAIATTNQKLATGLEKNWARFTMKRGEKKERYWIEGSEVPMNKSTRGQRGSYCWLLVSKYVQSRKRGFFWCSMASNNVVGCLLLNYRLQQASRSWEKRKELVISLIIISCPNLDLSLVCEWFSQKNNNEAQSGRSRSNGFHTTTPVFAPCRRYHYGQDNRRKVCFFFYLF